MPISGFRPPALKNFFQRNLRTFAQYRATPRSMLGWRCLWCLSITRPLALQLEAWKNFSSHKFNLHNSANKKSRKLFVHERGNKPKTTRNNPKRPRNSTNKQRGGRFAKMPTSYAQKYDAVLARFVLGYLKCPLRLVVCIFAAKLTFFAIVSLVGLWGVGRCTKSFRQIFWHNKVTESSWAKNFAVCLLIFPAKNYEMSVACGCCTKSISVPLHFLRLYW